MKENRENHVESISIASLNKNIFSTPEKFVDGLESSVANRALIDPFTISNHPDLKDCSSIHDSFLNKACEQLSYSAQEDDTCVATYSKNK